MNMENIVKKNFLKVVICGDGAVGKSTICKRLAGTLHGEVEDTKMTRGLDIHSFHVENSKIITCQLWDLGGQERFRSFQSEFFSGATIIILVFSLDRFQSFINLRDWNPLIKTKHPAKFFLLGNKADLTVRSIKRLEAQGFAEAYKMDYFEVSGINGIGFDDFRQSLTNEITRISFLQN